jgi:aryl-alcohol dehydrogenase-like predicted oxidoreductase
MDAADPNARGGSRHHIIEACEASLRRLQTDYIDLYQFHDPHSQAGVPIDESLRALDDLIRAGKVRYIGASNFSAWHLVEALWAAKEYGLNRLISEQPAYNLLDRRAERELIPMARSYDLAVLPWSPLAQGFLTGKYRRGETQPADARLVAGVSTNTGEHAMERAFDLVELLESMAHEKNLPVGQLALAWCVQQPGITSAIIGPRTLEQLEDNLAALNVSLTEEDFQRIDAIIPPGEMIVDYFRANQAVRARWI